MSTESSTFFFGPLFWLLTLGAFWLVSTIERA